MKFGYIIVLATLLGASTPAARADRIYGELTGFGTANISTTSLTFSKLRGGPGGTMRPSGIVADQSVDFAGFDTGTPFFYNFFAPYTFSYSNVSVSTPVNFFQVSDHGVNLIFYLTNIDAGSMVAATATTTGGFTGEGYVTLSNNFVGNTAVLDKTFVTFQLHNSGNGAGIKTFSFDMIAPTPEPSSLALLGTGILSIAGVAFRRLRSSKAA